MKKSAVLKILSVLVVAVLAFSLFGCAKDKEQVDTEPDVNNVVNDDYTVVVEESDAPIEYSDATEMLEDIRPTVVDVTTYLDSGSSAGSGVIIAGISDGSENKTEYFIVTNHHVIDGGKGFKVDVLSIAEDGSETTTAYDATLIGSSLKRDIAVLSILPAEGTVLKIATFIDNSDSVKVGTEVFAIGNPLGILGGTVTHGIVSATKRNVNVGSIGPMTLMQTDTSINGGNSGGGLFDAKGRLVGIINSGYDTYNGQNVEGLNFAIPANDAKFAVKSLIETHIESGGVVTRYGYVEGDAKIDIAFGTVTIYTDRTRTERGTYLAAQATTDSGALYETWGGGAKVLVSLAINGQKVDLSQSGNSSYALTAIANNAITSVKAGDSVVIEYVDIMTATSGGFFGYTYNYLGEETKSVTLSAEQYVYQP